MNVFFIYKNKTFGFEMKKDVSVSYLKKIVSNMIKKDKASIDLYYRNQILSQNNSTLFAIAKNETNVSITVLLNKNKSDKTYIIKHKMELPLLSQSSLINPMKTEISDYDDKEENNKLHLNSNKSETSSDYSKDVNKYKNLKNTYSKGLNNQTKLEIPQSKDLNIIQGNTVNTKLDKRYSKNSNKPIKLNDFSSKEQNIYIDSNSPSTKDIREYSKLNKKYSKTPNKPIKLDDISSKDSNNHRNSIFSSSKDSNSYDKLIYASSNNLNNQTKSRNSYLNDLNKYIESNDNSSSNGFNEYLNLITKSNVELEDNQNQKEFSSTNKVFEDLYNTKERKIINLMIYLKNNILLYDEVLFKKYKNIKDDKVYKGLLLFEKNIIKFKDKQIQFLKNIINYFDVKETSFSSGQLILEDLYQELNNYYVNKNTNAFIQNYSQKNKYIMSRNLTLKPNNLTELELPKITLEKNINDNLTKYNKSSKDLINDNISEIKEKTDKKLIKPINLNENSENLKEENNTLIEKNKEKKEDKLILGNNNRKFKRSKTVNLSIRNENLNNNKKMNIILSKISEDKFENDNSSDSEICLNSKNMKKSKEKMTENKKGNLLGRAKTMKDKSVTKNSKLRDKLKPANNPINE